jgi:hypothetical protein
MNHDKSTESQRQRFAEAAQAFTGIPHKRFAALMPFRDSITQLRSKGASFALIRDMLDTISVTSSTDSVRRFVREVIEKGASRGKKSRAKVQAKSPLSESSTPQPPPNNDAPFGIVVGNVTTTAPRTRGPRIADPSKF